MELTGRQWLLRITAMVEQTANTIVDMMNTEAMMNVRVAYGTIVQELKDVSKSYKEASMALDVGKIFYVEKKVNAYGRLGIGRLIYQLPVNLCKIYIDEIFGEKDRKITGEYGADDRSGCYGKAYRRSA